MKRLEVNRITKWLILHAFNTVRSCKESHPNNSTNSIDTVLIFIDFSFRFNITHINLLANINRITNLTFKRYNSATKSHGKGNF